VEREGYPRVATACDHQTTQDATRLKLTMACCSGFQRQTEILGFGRLGPTMPCQCIEDRRVRMDRNRRETVELRMVRTWDIRRGQ
jgi:hypothetical protein